MDVTWNAPNVLYALWLLPALAGLVWLAARRRRRAAAAFLDAPMRARLLPAPSGLRVVLRGALLLLACAACILALARPQWGLRIDTVTRRGADLFVLLDVSRSMLSRDVAPSRLERAKADVRDLLPRLRGERVGLIAFAGKAVVACPLTTDHAFFRTVLGSLGPDSAPRGGTAIGDAIRKALGALAPDAERDRALLLITDGEDHASFPAEAAALAAERGVRVFTVGLGDPVEGARVPVVDDQGNRVFLEYEGEQVWSRMDESLLRSIALETGGAYVPARTSAYDLGAIYERHLARLAGGEGRQERRERRPERFQFFLAAGLLAFALRAWLRPWARPAALLALLVFAAPAARAGDDAVGRALESYRAGNLEAARDLLAEASERAPGDALLAYDHAAVLHELGARDEAKARYLVATRGDDAQVAARAYVNLGLLAVDEAREAFGGAPEAAAGGQREAGVEAIARAQAHFRAALDRDPDDGVARRNLERLKLWLARTREEWQRRDEEEKQRQEEQEPSPLDDLAKLRDEQRALRGNPAAAAEGQRGLLARLDDVLPRLTAEMEEQARAQVGAVAGQARAAMEQAAAALEAGGDAVPAQTAAFLVLDGLWNALAPFDAQVKQAIEVCRDGIAGTEARDDDLFLPEQPRRVAASAPMLDAKAQQALAMQQQAPGGSAPGAPPPLPRSACEKAIEHAPRIEELGRGAGDDLDAGRFDDALEKQREALRLLEEIARELPQDQQQQPQQGEQEQDEQEKSEQEQQQQDPGEQQQQQEQEQPESSEQEKADAPPPQEIEALLRKAEEREREYRERKREELRRAAAAAGKVERDW